MLETLRLVNGNDNLEGWKWWAWQLGGGLIGVIIAEYLFNMLGMTMLPLK